MKKYYKRQHANNIYRVEEHHTYEYLSPDGQRWILSSSVADKVAQGEATEIPLTQAQAWYTVKFGPGGDLPT